MEQSIKLSGSIRAQGLSLVWEASVEGDEDDCSNYRVLSSSALLKVGDSYESAVDGQSLAFFLRSVDDAMPRTGSEEGETSKVEYQAQLDALLLVMAKGDGFVSVVAPNGASTRLECQDFLSWSRAVGTTLYGLRTPTEPRYFRKRRR